MVRFEKHKIFWQILLWWSSWALITFLLTYGLESTERFLRLSVRSLIGIAIIISLNIKFLLPQLYFQKKTGGFILAGVVLLVLVSFLLFSSLFPWSDWFHPLPKHDGPLPREDESESARRAIMRIREVGRMMPFVLTFLGSTLIEVTRFANKKEKEAIHSEKEKLETELKFLKSQVNPHFLFNALNNIYSLSVMQAPQTSESVMQLSEILRYMVYDSNEEKVPLESEIAYIENYVNLKLLKDSRGMDVQLNLDKSSPRLMIPPLLFIPFVENAFKHSKIENLRSGFIKIDLKTQNGQVQFKVQNSLPANGFTKDKVGGVGLENIQKRLDLLYPGDQHDLKIRQTEGQFDIDLKLSLQ